jgi:hypothetical protein
VGIRLGGAAARRCSRPVCARCRAPDAILRIARHEGSAYCVVRKAWASAGSVVVEKEPGMRRMWNWGALEKEFCWSVRSGGLFG